MLTTRENQKTRLTLVMPPTPGLMDGFASGLVSLASYVSVKLPDIAVEILDLGALPLRYIEREIAEHKADPSARHFVGITTTTASYQAALRAGRAFKTHLPDCTVVLGGHHASADAERVVGNSDAVDFVIIGEGEKTLTDFVSRYPEVSDLPGLAYMDGERFVKKDPDKQSLLTENELDSIPLTFNGEGYWGTPGKFEHATYVSARGCPLSCAFCSVGGERIRHKSVERVIQDVRELVLMGLSRLAIEDNFFAHNAKRTRGLCLALARLRAEKGMDFTWDCQTRLESMDRPGMVALFEDAGCEAVYLGVESINPDQLLYLNKTSTPEKYLDTLRDKVVGGLLGSSVSCYINLQFGIPGETKQHNQHTYDYLKILGKMARDKGKRITIFPQLHVVYPGTAHFRSGVAEGRFPPDIFEYFTSWEADQAPVLEWLGEHFAHGTGGIPEGVIDAETLKNGKEGNYKVNSDAVLRVSSILTRIGRLPGIEVFRYGPYLVQPDL